ncbi:O-antigen ligase family protein [Terasakiella sp. A23]|uniref:O-antigen ligase family protein n=1 Tax=Terasakiella sp. FCG-A23 TaxID=3080561 RepID=UPI0029549F01|nr:O-antigen ligase family protein [Terasakiella sp. A23]MDV7339295.1 O-antigen ligase family protein [Terasakiella sp. A23]
MLQKVTFYGFLGTILLAPLPFGSNREWSWTLLCTLIGFWLFLECLPIWKKEKDEKRTIKQLAPLLLVFVGFCIWALFQSFPLGNSSELAHPIWTEASAILGLELNHSISINAQDTTRALMIMLSYGGCFWLSARFCRSSDNARIVLKAFMYASSIYAFYGLLIYFFGFKTVLWFDKWAYQNDVTSTFINRNTYATYAALGVIVSIAVLFQTVGSQLRGNLTQREIFRILVDNASKKAWFPFFALLLNTTALLQTHSRGGFLSLTLALLVLVVCLAYIRLLPKKLLIGSFSVVAFGAFFAFTMSSDLTVKRLEGTSFERSLRDDVYLLTIDAIESSPLLGTGYGTYQEAFRSYKNNDIRLSWNNWDKAHNTYLEMAMETGLIATIAIAFIFIFAFIVNVRGVLKRRRRQIYAVVSASSIVLVAAHALVDFSLQIPGFTVSFLLLAGMGWAQSRTSRRRSSGESGSSI